jgi:hypothetical protein
MINIQIIYLFKNYSYDKESINSKTEKISGIKRKMFERMNKNEKSY